MECIQAKKCGQFEDDLGGWSRKAMHFCAVDVGYNTIEREGLSVWHPCCPAAVIATWDPEEGELRPHLLDRLAMHVGTSDGPVRTAPFGLPIFEGRLSGEQFLGERSNGASNGSQNGAAKQGGGNGASNGAVNGKAVSNGVKENGVASNGASRNGTANGAKLNGQEATGTAVNGTSVRGNADEGNGASEANGKGNPWFGLRGLFSSSEKKGHATEGGKEYHKVQTSTRSGSRNGKENGANGNENAHELVNGQAGPGFEWRTEAVGRVLDFSEAPNRPVVSTDQESELRDKVLRGQEILRGGVTLMREQTRYLVQEAIRGQCEGHRAEAFAARVAKAHAALRGARVVTADDLRAAVELAILPRSKEMETDMEEEEEGEEIILDELALIRSTLGRLPLGYLSTVTFRLEWQRWTSKLHCVQLRS